MANGLLVVSTLAFGWTWERLNTALRERLRSSVGSQLQPSAAILDSQSVKTTSVGGIRGYDGAKKLSGRKRHVLVETQDLVLKVKVHSAELQDRAGVPLVLRELMNNSRISSISGSIRATLVLARAGSKNTSGGM